MPLRTNEPIFSSSSTRRILFREKEKEMLHNFFGPTSCVPYPNMFIYGHSSTGKSSLISELLEEMKLPSIWINCNEFCSSQQLLMGSIVQQVCDLTDTNCSTEEHCGNVCDLMNFLKRSLKNVHCTTFLVFDNAEILKAKQPTILPALMHLQEVTELNVGVILISEVVWEKFRGSACLFDPIVIHLMDYNKEQLIDILCLDCPPDYSHDFYENYVNIIMKVFFLVTRNLNELRHVARLNFAKYCEPVISGEVSETNVLKLFRNIEPTLKEAIHAVYLREVSGPKWNKLLEKTDYGTIATRSTTAGSKFHMMKELPFYSKFLLIASYLASYNAPKSDFKHFVKNQGKQKKKRNQRKSQKNRHLLGPKCFALDRMLSIFFSIVGHCVLPSALILSQVSSLCSLNLISRISNEEQLDMPKYKCLAELDLVRNIGKTINVDIMNYLDDFLS